MNFVRLELFPCRGVERGADVVVLPRRVRFCHADDISAERRDT